MLTPQSHPPIPAHPQYPTIAIIVAGEVRYAYFVVTLRISNYRLQFGSMYSSAGEEYSFEEVHKLRAKVDLLEGKSTVLEEQFGMVIGRLDTLTTGLGNLTDAL